MSKSKLGFWSDLSAWLACTQPPSCGVLTRPFLRAQVERERSLVSFPVLIRIPVFINYLLIGPTSRYSHTGS